MIASRSSDFINHSYDYRPNWTPLGPITIINHNHSNFRKKKKIKTNTFKKNISSSENV